MPKNVYTFIGKEPGKTLTIMAGVHGDEICGVRLFEKILSKFEIRRGTTNLIYGNPRAIEKNVRFTEMNLNRAFRVHPQFSEQAKKTYEYGRAEELKPILQTSDALLDIHSSNSENSTPFIICEPPSYPIVSYFPFPIRSSGWDAIEPGGTDYFVNLHKGYGICIECGYHLDPQAVLRAGATLQIFLTLMGAIDGETPKKNFNQREINVFSAPIVKEEYKPIRNFADFEKLQTGELIGYDGETSFFAPPKSVIIFGGKPRKRGEEAFILGKE